jgi:hypothetical protein
LQQVAEGVSQTPSRQRGERNVPNPSGNIR